MKTVEELYEKIAVLQTRALELHPERYKTPAAHMIQQSADILVEDIPPMARLISATKAQSEADFADLKKEKNETNVDLGMDL